MHGPVAKQLTVCISTNPMRRLLRMLLLLSWIGCHAAEKIQPLKVKVGLWQTTMTGRTSGALPVPPDVMARLTPEQRAKVEEQIRSSAGEAQTSTYKNCLNEGDLEKGPNFGQADKECTQVVVNSSSRKMEMRFECKGTEMNMSGNVTVEALSPESLKGLVHSSFSSDGHTADTTATFTSHWIGSKCTDSSE